MNWNIKLILFFFLLLSMAGCEKSNIEIVVHNESAQSIHNVQLQYIDKTEELFTIEPYKFRSVAIEPKHDSGLKITYTNGDNRQINSDIDTYFGSGGYHGKIEIFVNQEKVEDVKQDISIK